MEDNGVGFGQPENKLGLASGCRGPPLLSLVDGELLIEYAGQWDEHCGSGAIEAGRRRRDPRPRVLLADDHRMMTEGLKALLHEEFELVGIVGDGRAMIEAAEKLRPGVVVADVTMPNLNGFEALTQLGKTHPNIKVVFLTMHQNAAYARRRALEAGAFGFVVKHSTSDELVVAIHAALRRKTFLPLLNERGGRAGREWRSRREGRSECAHVTPGESLQLLAEGFAPRRSCERAFDFGANCRIP